MKLSAISTFETPVKIKVPSGTNSGYEVTLICEFKIGSKTAGEKSAKEVETMFPIEGLSGDDLVKAYEKRAAENIGRVLLGVGGFENEDGTPVSKKDGVAVAQDYPWMLSAILEAFQERMGNIRVKN